MTVGGDCGPAYGWADVRTTKAKFVKMESVGSILINGVRRFVLEEFWVSCLSQEREDEHILYPFHLLS